jgi:DNA-binding GntR family transcriptional regulator
MSKAIKQELTLKLKQIKTERPRLADQVYHQLLEAINLDKIDSDERLVQEKIAADMQISRTPVREALLRLEQEGILRVSKRGGFVIHQMDEREIKELYQLRTAIEGQAARIVTINDDENDIKKLRKIIETEEDITTHTVEAYFNANLNIHRAVVNLSQNRYLLETFDNIWSRSSSYRMFSAIEKVDLPKSLGHHMELVDVIATGDTSQVMETFAKHIEDGLDLQIKAIQK